MKNEGEFPIFIKNREFFDKRRKKQVKKLIF